MTTDQSTPNPRYRISDGHVRDILLTASLCPDIRDNDPLGRDHGTVLAIWRDQMVQTVRRACAEAWAQGAAWGIQYTSKLQVIVSPEQYDKLKEQAGGE